uniref:Uncharacterized protein n=1 Tax=viral metagenome TaxID=1070528 RepID=A0A6C0EVA9_9ZZZZ
MSCSWNIPFKSAILTKNDKVIHLEIGQFIKFENMGPVRIDSFTGNDPTGPMGIEFLPWNQGEWAEYTMSLRGNPYHIICRPAGETHYGYHVDWNTFEFVNGGIPPLTINYKTQVLKSGVRHICYIDEIANFEIYEYKGTNTTDNVIVEIIPSLSISVEEEHQGKGYAKRKIKKMLKTLQMPKETLLYIDTDASAGFWRHIGMIDNLNGNGYELVVSVEQLNNYVNH